MTLREAVRQVFYDFNAPLEGVIPFYYSDVRKLVTIGVGNLVDPIDVALALPMRRPDGTLASTAEKRKEWLTVKHDSRAPRGGAPYARKITTLRLPEADIRALVEQRLTDMATDLGKRLPDFGRYVADVQLALLSMAWAMGTGFVAKFPKFIRAIKAGDWVAAADQGVISTVGNPGIAPRNARNRALLLAAVNVTDPDVLLGWPLPTTPAAPPTTSMDTVRGVQEALIALGFDLIKADGIWGPMSRGATMAFQAAHRLKVDGIAGPRTKAAIATALEALATAA